MPVSRSFSSTALATGLALLAMAALPASALAADVPAPLLDSGQDTLAALASDEAPSEQAAIDEAAVECMAKVVLHEAGGEPYDGKVAVAQTLVNRLGAKRFGDSICAIVNQPGQFFNTAAYNPDRDRPGWAAAVAVARAVLRGDEDDVAPGAMFFRSAAHAPSTFFRSRQRIASVGQQVFYR